MQAPLQEKVESDVVQTNTARAAMQERRLMDNRPAALVQRKLAEMMNNSPRVLQQRALSDAIHNSSRMVAQRHEMNALFGGSDSPQGNGAMPDELSPAQREERPNNTGLPNQLKSGIKSLSGMNMDHVKVHYNSEKPAQLQAHAYAQGSEIHLSAGQERHLPHEAWHIVQQAQGRVRPTLQMKAGAINDDPLLEKEADMMGDKAARFEHNHDARNLVAEERVAGIAAQRVAGFPQTAQLIGVPTVITQRRLSDTILSSSYQAAQKRDSDFIQGNTLSTAQRQPAGALWPVQLQQTVSGHGSLLRDAQGALVNYTVPAGKKVIRAAPPGATLGDISFVLNVTTAPDPATMRARVKVSTTAEFWGNIAMVTAVKVNAAIPKTALQTTLLAGICDGTAPYSGLTGGNKGSLTSLEKKAEFEAWAKATVAPQTFTVINAAEVMNDMVLATFEDHLKSKNSAVQNHYITAGTKLSDHIANNPAHNEFVVNACSHDPSSTYTGFQIDG